MIRPRSARVHRSIMQSPTPIVAPGFPLSSGYQSSQSRCSALFPPFRRATVWPSRFTLLLLRQELTGSRSAPVAAIHTSRSASLKPVATTTARSAVRTGVALRVAKRASRERQKMEESKHGKAP